MGVMIGANDAKTACEIAVLKDIQENTKIPFDRFAMGFQSHITQTTFVSKAELTNTFATLAQLGVEAMVTEIDITLDSPAEENLRLQAAIWGDYIDVSRFSGAEKQGQCLPIPNRLVCSQATATSSSAGIRATTCRGSGKTP